MTIEEAVCRIADCYPILGADRADGRQEALLALQEARRDYDPTRGPFDPFARHVVRRRLSDACKAARRQKQRILSDAARDDDLAAVADEKTDPAVVVEYRLDLQAILAALPSLTAVERQALRLAVNGLPYSHEKRLDNGLVAARRKLRSAAA